MGSHAIPLTQEVCVPRVATLPPLATSQTMTVRSREQEAMREPSGLQVTSVTLLLCPLRDVDCAQFS